MTDKIKCPCGLRDHMEESDCEKTDCDKCCPLAKGDGEAVNKMLFKNFEVRPYKNVEGKVVEDKYELVKWREKDSSGKSYCFVVGYLEYDDKEPGWNFRGCGLRYQEHYENGLNEFILKYVDILNLQKQYFNADMKEFYEHY